MSDYDFDTDNNDLDFGFSEVELPPEGKMEGTILEIKQVKTKRGTSPFVVSIKLEWENEDGEPEESIEKAWFDLKDKKRGARLANELMGILEAKKVDRKIVSADGSPINLDDHIGKTVQLKVVRSKDGEKIFMNDITPV